MGITSIYAIVLWAVVIACSIGSVYGIKYLFSRYFKKEIKGSKFFLLIAAISGFLFAFFRDLCCKKNWHRRRVQSCYKNNWHCCFYNSFSAYFV